MRQALASISTKLWHPSILIGGPTCQSIVNSTARCTVGRGPRRGRIAKYCFSPRLFPLLICFPTRRWPCRANWQPRFCKRRTCSRASSVLRIESSRAGVVQWQYRSFPSFGRGFDSHRPLQILKDLRSRAGFHGFQNINFVAKLHGKFSANLFERDFTGVKSRHRSGGMTHLLTNNGGVYSCKFPSPVAAS